MSLLKIINLQCGEILLNKKQMFYFPLEMHSLSISIVMWVDCLKIVIDYITVQINV